MSVQKARQGYKLVKSLFRKYEEIPVEWEMEKARNIFKVTMGQSPPSESYNQNAQGLPFYQGVTDFGVIYPKPTVWCSDPKKTAKEREILFSVRAPVGETNITESKCCLGRGIASLNPQKNDLYYCFYLVTYNKKRFSVYSQGTTYDAINRDDITKTKLPFTSNKLEQQKIASILSNVDSLIDQTQKIIDQTIILKKGLMQKLLTRGIGHKKFKEIQFGTKWMKFRIPEEWETKKLTQVAKFRQGLQIDKEKRYSDHGNNRIKLIKILDFYDGNDSGEYIDIPSDSKNVICDEDDIIIARTGNTLGMILTGVTGVFHNNTFALDYDQKLFHKMFFFYFLKSSPVQILMKIISTRTGQPDLTHKEFSILTVPIPQLAEQQKIAFILSNVDSKISELESKKFTLQKLKKGLMQKLLTGQIRVTV